MLEDADVVRIGRGEPVSPTGWDTINHLDPTWDARVVTLRDARLVERSRRGDEGGAGGGARAASGLRGPLRRQGRPGSPVGSGAGVHLGYHRGEPDQLRCRRKAEVDGVADALGAGSCGRSSSSHPLDAPTAADARAGDGGVLRLARVGVVVAAAGGGANPDHPPATGAQDGSGAPVPAVGGKRQRLGFHPGWRGPVYVG